MFPVTVWTQMGQNFQKTWPRHVTSNLSGVSLWETEGVKRGLEKGTSTRTQEAAAPFLFPLWRRP